MNVASVVGIVVAFPHEEPGSLSRLKRGCKHPLVTSDQIEFVKLGANRMHTLSNCKPFRIQNQAKVQWLLV